MELQGIAMTPLNTSRVWKRRRNVWRDARDEPLNSFFLNSHMHEQKNLRMCTPRSIDVTSENRILEHREMSRVQNTQTKMSVPSTLCSALYRQSTLFHRISLKQSLLWCCCSVMLLLCISLPGTEGGRIATGPILATDYTNTYDEAVNSTSDSTSLPSLPELDTRPSEQSVHPNRIFLQRGHTFESELPTCSPNSVCTKVSTYGTPYAERMCRCPGQNATCSTSLEVNDGHTVVNKEYQFKLCEPVHQLQQCKLFSEVSYSLIFYPDNVTQQIMHCTCPENAVSYVINKNPYKTDKGLGFFYSFACSPVELICRRKEPCRLFSARKRTDFDEVNTTILCRCPPNRKCPAHHSDHGVVPGKIYGDDNIRTYSGYCI